MTDIVAKSFNGLAQAALMRLYLAYKAWEDADFEGDAVQVQEAYEDIWVEAPECDDEHPSAWELSMGYRP